MEERNRPLCEDTISASMHVHPAALNSVTGGQRVVLRKDLPHDRGFLPNFVPDTYIWSTSVFI